MKCLYCKKDLINKQKIYCNTKCQRDLTYKSFIKRWQEGIVSGVKIDGSVSKYIRRYLYETRGERCERCGWCEINPTTGRSPLELEHLDGDWNNNKESNLSILCPNCHSLTSTYRALNRGKGREYRKKYYTTVAGE